MADGFFRSKKGYTVIQNGITRDHNVSLKAKGLYLIIQSYITMPGKKWKKEEFRAQTCEGKKAFDSAWNELKEKGYLKVHMYSNGATWSIEYELLDEAQEGAHTFYYNGKGTLTRTNIERSKTKTEKSKENQKEVRTPLFGSNGKGINENGNNGSGSNGKGRNNNNSLLISPITNTNAQSYPQSMEYDDGQIDAEIEQIKINISYDELMTTYDLSLKQKYEELYGIIIDVVCVARKKIKVNQEEYPYQLVKAQFFKLRKEHLEYVASRMESNFAEIRNVRAYLITALYNAPNTYENYLCCEVNHDLYGA